MAYLRKVMRKQNEGMSERVACKSLNINNKQIQTWRKQSTQLKEIKNRKAKSLHIGMASILHGVTDALLRFVFELREQAMAVSITMVMLQAAKLSREFKEKSRHAQYQASRRFVNKHSLVYRMGTNECQ